MLKILLVGIGGSIGSISRYLMSDFAYRFSNGNFFPYGTATVNLVGCLAVGLLAGLGEHRGLFSSEARVFLMFGILGGFTTFSAFGFETYELVRAGQNSAAAFNVVLNVILGLVGVWLGFSAARWI